MRFSAITLTMLLTTSTGQDIWSKKMGDETQVDANVIDDGIVAINHKDNKEIEEKLDVELADDYFIVAGTIILKWMST